MRTVKLYGELAIKFTDSIDLAINNAAEAIRALSANFEDFRGYLLSYTPGFIIKVGELSINREDIANPVGKDETIHIIPHIVGSGKAGSIILGAVLIAATWGAGAAVVAGKTTIGAVGSFGGFAVSAGTAAAIQSMGVGLVLTGISSLLFAPPRQQVQTAVENTPNTYFNGAVNTISQGLPVPVGYGKLLVGSAVISAGINVTSTSTVDTNTLASIEADLGLYRSELIPHPTVEGNIIVKNYILFEENRKLYPNIHYIEPHTTSPYAGYQDIVFNYIKLQGQGTFEITAPTFVTEPITVEVLDTGNQVILRVPNSSIALFIEAPNTSNLTIVGV